MSKDITLKDVARLAGVSTATVARVLHNNGYVADGTRKRVKEVLEETGYHLNTFARGLRKQETLTVGHMIHSISPNPFFAGVAMGAESELIEHGYTMLIFNSHGDARREKMGVMKFIGQRVDAIIFTTPVDARNVQLAVDAGFPVVQIERPTPVQTHAVLVDNYTGSFDAVEHLIKLGHHQIAFIGGDPNYYPVSYTISGRRVIEEERLAGYLDALRKYSIPIEDDLVVLGEYYTLEEGGFDGAGYSCMKRFLQRSTRPTAVFATCDILAAGVLQAIYEAGLHIPSDLSIVGFDNTYAPYLAPPLTTVEQPVFEIGKQAASLIIDHLQNNHSWESRVETLSTRLIVRSSTGPRPR